MVNGFKNGYSGFIFNDNLFEQKVILYQNDYCQKYIRRLAILKWKSLFWESKKRQIFLLNQRLLIDALL